MYAKNGSFFKRLSTQKYRQKRLRVGSNKDNDTDNTKVLPYKHEDGIRNAIAPSRISFVIIEFRLYTVSRKRAQYLIGAITFFIHPQILITFGISDGETFSYRLHAHLFDWLYFC